jgi:phosphate transport system protein
MMTVHFVNLLEDLRKQSQRMADLVADMLDEACEAVFTNNQAVAQRVIDRDTDVDNMEVEVEAEVIRLMALHQPVGSDLRMLCTILKINNDLERIADCAVNIAKRSQHLVGQSVLEDSADAVGLSKKVCAMFQRAAKAYSTEDESLAREVLAEDDAVDELYVAIVRRGVKIASLAPDSMASHLDMLTVAKNLERIADHSTNIAEDVIFLVTGQIVRHGNY